MREILLSLFSVSRLRLLLYRFLVYNLNCVMLLAYCSTIKLCIMHVYVHNTHIFERVRACVRSCVCVCVYLFFFLPVCEHSCVHLCECKLCVYKDWSMNTNHVCIYRQFCHIRAAFVHNHQRIGFGLKFKTRESKWRVTRAQQRCTAR